MGAALKVAPVERFNRPQGVEPRQLAYSHTVILQNVGMTFDDVLEALEEVYEAAEDVEGAIDDVISLKKKLESKTDDVNEAEEKIANLRERIAGMANDWDAEKSELERLLTVARTECATQTKIAATFAMPADERVKATVEALDHESDDHKLTQQRLAEAHEKLAEAHAEIGVLRLAAVKPKRAPRKAKAV